MKRLVVAGLLATVIILAAFAAGSAFNTTVLKAYAAYASQDYKDYH